MRTVGVARMAAERNRPLYLGQATRAYASLARRLRVVFHDVVNARGEHVAHAFDVPFSEDCDDAALALRDRYLRAQLNNLLVTFGGAGLTIYLPLEDERLARGMREALARFDFDRPTNDRTGFGSFANYISRINRAAGLPAFTVSFRDIEDFIPPPADRAYRLFRRDNLEAERRLLRRGVTELEGKTFVGLDVGGTGIKAAAIVDGGIAALFGYPWHPATFTTVDEIVDPIVAISRLLAAAATLYRSDPGHALLADLRDCGHVGARREPGDLEREILAAIAGAPGLLDGLVCGFPDIVIKDKVVGGEVYKLRGIRQRDPAAYDGDFAAIMNLDDTLRALCRPDGATVVMNDGFVTSVVISVERTFAPGGESDDSCLLVHTVGTEMGTGIISPAGPEQDIPIEGYNWIIDLGCDECSPLDPDDVRSCDNFNTAVPGTVQKIISQSGLIRLAMRNFRSDNPSRVDQLVTEGLLVWENRNGVEVLAVADTPHDRRSDLVRRLVAFLKDGDEAVRNAYREMGMAMGVLIEAMNSMLEGVEKTRFVSGGVVADDECFALFLEGLKRAYPDFEVKRLDAEASYSPLLRTLPCDDIGFMTAVGSCYVASRRLLASRE